eukprot:m.254668 g.254668  ORF g.254668 m.254668 type:complete len:508 (+) comp16176_c0_seq1:191-1714(+)
MMWFLSSQGRVIRVILPLIVLIIDDTSTLVQGLWPRPQPQTEVQRTVYAELKQTATSEATAALNKAKDRLDSEGVRQLLHPSLASLSRDELWARYSGEMDVVEIAHGFPANDNPHQNNALDLDVEIAKNATWFYNQWQLPILYKAREERAFYQLVSYLAPAAAFETGRLNFPPFSSPIPFPNVVWPGGWPSSLAESSNRVVYAVLNQHKIDFPCFPWGDVAVVFNTSYIRDMILLTSIDTGDWTCACDTNFTTDFCTQWTNISSCHEFWYCHWDNSSKRCLGGENRAPTDPGHNCSAWGACPVGTLDAHAHLLNPYADWYGPHLGDERLALLLNRLLVPWANVSNVTISLFDYYFEADLVGNPWLPESIKFVMASVPELFGTSLGQEIRNWCQQKKWVLVWALGMNAGKQHLRSFKGNQRLLDPATVTNVVNASIAGSLSQFDSVWNEALGVRNYSQPSNETIAAWYEKASSIVGPGGCVQPLNGNSCEKPDMCVGTNDNNECVCYL